MKLFTLLSFFVFGFSYSQTYEEGTNPLAPLQPPPISKSEKQFNEQYKQKEPVEIKLHNNDTVFPLSENVKNYQHEQAQDTVLKDFKQKELAFNNYNSPAPVINPPTSNNLKIDFKLFGIIIGIIAIIIFVIIFLYSKKNKKR